MMNRVRTAAAIIAVFAVAMLLPGKAVAHPTEITMVGTLYVPIVATAEVGHPVVFTNAEPTDYPVVLGRHDVSPDREIGSAGNGIYPFPTFSGAIQPGRSWTWVPPASARGKTFAFKCSVHPNWQRGLIVVQ